MPPVYVFHAAAAAATGALLVLLCCRYGWVDVKIAKRGSYRWHIFIQYTIESRGSGWEERDAEKPDNDGSRTELEQSNKFHSCRVYGTFYPQPSSNEICSCKFIVGDSAKLSLRSRELL